MNRELFASQGEIYAIDTIRDVLREENYGQLYRQVTNGNLIAPDVQRARVELRLLPARERELLELLALGEANIASLDNSPLNKLFVVLIESGLARYDADTQTLRTDGWVLIPALGGYLMSGTPAPYTTKSGSVGASAYIGSDSLLLAAALSSSHGRRILDLGCGAGLQGLLAARGAREAVLTDIDELSLRFSELNARLNDVDHELSIRCGSFYEPVVGERFDTIVVLPPYVPSVSQSGTSPTVDGGPDGLAFIRPLLRGAAEHLTDGGEFIAICQLLCDANGPLLLREIDDLATELEVRISVSNWHPLQPYALELASRLCAHGALTDVRTLMDRYLKSLRGFGITGTCTADIRAVRKARGLRTDTRVIGRAPRVTANSVPIITEGHAIERIGEMDIFSLTNGTKIALNLPTGALVRATDGLRNIREIVSLGWNLIDAAPTTQSDLEDQALERFMELEASGLVTWS